MQFAHGDVYVGEWKESMQHGVGTPWASLRHRYSALRIHFVRARGAGQYTYVSGEVEIGKYKQNADSGTSVRWSADGARAWELKDGNLVREIDVGRARKIAKAVGLPPPGSVQSHE